MVSLVKSEPINVTLPELTTYQAEHLFHPARVVVIEASTKSGKAQPLDSLVYTPDGPTRMGSLKVGDLVLTPSGSAPIIAIHPQGVRDVMRLTFFDGTVVEADKDHLWGTHRAGTISKVVSTGEMMDWSNQTLKRTWVPAIKPAAFNGRDVQIDPYLLGALIGDGGMSQDTLSFSNADQYILDRVRAALPDGHCLRPRGGCDFYVSAGSKSAKLRQAGTHIRGMLQRMGLGGKLSHEKFIPDDYRFNSVEVRLEVLRGIFDTDGFVDPRGQPHIEQTSEQLARDITEVIQSLGGSVLTTFRAVNGYRAEGGRFIKGRPVWRQCIRIADSASLFATPRKTVLCRKRRKTGHRTFRSIQFARRAETQCIEIDDPRHLYLTSGFIPTHNTLGCILWQTNQVLNDTRSLDHWWVAPVYTQAQIAYRRAKAMLPREIFTSNDSDHRLDFINGSRWWFKSGEKSDNLYGEDVASAVIDEASRMREESYIALRSTLTATKGPMRIIGNVKGRKNWAWRAARRAEAGEKGMHFAKFTAHDAIRAGIFDDDELESARRDLPEAAFQELYFAEASDDHGNPFGHDAIRACIADLSKQPVQSWGVDLAKSVDWTVAIGIDAAGAVAQIHRYQKPWAETTRHIGETVGHNRAFIDSTGVGDPIVESLQKTARLVTGFKFTSQSKQQLMEGLALAIQRGEISYPDGVIVAELDAFEYEYTRTGVKYGAPAGQHDDAVMALALAVACRNSKKAPWVPVSDEPEKEERIMPDRILPADDDFIPQGFG